MTIFATALLTTVSAYPVEKESATVEFHPNIGNPLQCYGNTYQAYLSYNRYSLQSCVISESVAIV